jgi:two-component system, response regulator YesN
MENKMAYDWQGLFHVINNHLLSSAHLSLEDLSRRIRVERHTIEKAVKQATGLTFRKLRNQVMLEKAKALLKSEPNRSIKEIAFKLNYRSHRAFSRFVRTMGGYSPKEFRQMRGDRTSETP